jgi:hypothetical protein
MSEPVSARPELEVGEVGSPRDDSLLPTDKQRKKIEKELNHGIHILCIQYKKKIKT